MRTTGVADEDDVAVGVTAMGVTSAVTGSRWAGLRRSNAMVCL